MAIDVNQISETLSDYLVEQDPQLNINAACNKFTHRGVTLSVSAFKASILADTELLDACQLGYISVIAVGEQKKISDKVALLLQTRFVKQREARRQALVDSGLSSPDEVNVLDSDNLDTEEFLALVDYRTGAKHLLHIPSHRVSEIAFDVWMEAQGRPKFYEYKLAEFVYDPYDIVPFKALELPSGERITRVNTYIPPEWRIAAEEVTYTPSCPVEIEKFLRHLFPLEQSYEYTLGWLKMAILDRCETALVINGAKGSGKGVFSNLFGALIGQDHFKIAPKSLLGSGQFNSVLEDNRGIYIDEFKVTKAKHSDMKRFTNALQSVERKGDDAVSMQTFNSFLVTNNDIQDMFLEHDDRRFSVLDTTQSRLVDIMSRTDIAKLEKSFLDLDTITRVGHWILNRESGFIGDVKNPYRGETFHKLVYAHLQLWQQFVVDKVLSLAHEDEEDRADPDFNFPTIEDLQKVFRSQYKEAKTFFPSKEDTIQSFLRSFDYRDMGYIGKIARNEDRDLAFKINMDLVETLIAKNNLTELEENEDDTDGL